MLKLFPSLLGGVLNSVLRSDVSVTAGIAGLQYKMKSA